MSFNTCMYCKISFNENKFARGKLLKDNPLQKYECVNCANRYTQVIENKKNKELDGQKITRANDNKRY